MAPTRHSTGSSLLGRASPYAFLSVLRSRETNLRLALGAGGGSDVPLLPALREARGGFRRGKAYTSHYERGGAMPASPSQRLSGIGQSDAGRYFVGYTACWMS